MDIGDNMSIELQPDSHNYPEELSRLIEKVSDLILEKDTLINHGRVQAETDYYLLLGKDQQELFELELEYRKLRHVCELIQADLNASREPDIDLIRAKVDLEEREWQEKINKLKENILASVDTRKNALTLEDSQEVKTIYRSLVKILHPDINSNLTVKQVEMWHLVQSAFKKADLETLRNVFIIITREMPQSTDKKCDTRSLMETLRERINMLSQEIGIIRQSFPFNMIEKLQNEEWVENELSLINQKKEIFSDQIEYYQNRFETLKMICQNGKLSKN